ncbi:MAG: hypothetical protein ABWY52_08740 [Candidatus Limnocylindrales bacterium]
MPCLFVLFAAFAPRLLLIFLWIARPNLVGQAFETFLIPLLGFIFLPFTTLMWLLLWAGSGGDVSGFDWVWIGIAVVLDLGHWAGGAANQRGIPATGASAPAMSAAPMMSSTSGVPMTPAARATASEPALPTAPEPGTSPTPQPAPPPPPTAEASAPAGDEPPSA